MLSFGFALLCGQAACVWYSRKQRMVVTSTTEAEYISLAEGGKAIVWATKWLKGLRFMPMNGDPAACGIHSLRSCDRVKGSRLYQAVRGARTFSSLAAASYCVVLSCCALLLHPELLSSGPAPFLKRKPQFQILRSECNDIYTMLRMRTRAYCR